MSEARSVVLERDLPYPPARVWRALTVPELVAEWLMPNDFRAEAGRDFDLTAPFGPIRCRVIAVEPERRLAYAWKAFSLDSIVTFTLTPQEGGTRLRMEQAGFVRDQVQEFHGARAGWGRFLDLLADLLARKPFDPNRKDQS